MSANYTITIPDLTTYNALNFTTIDYKFIPGSTVSIDYSNMNEVQPFGMLVFGYALRKLINDNKDVDFQGVNFEHNSYASHMGFFRSIYLNYGNSPGEAAGSSTYLPVTNINVKALRIESYGFKEEVQNTIERKSNHLAQVLSRGNKTLSSLLGYSIRELMRNIYEHTTAENIWFAAQYWPTKGIVEIAILDEGEGIKQALSVNPNLNIRDDYDSLLLSIEPGISGRAFIHNGKMRRQKGSIWDNSGYGLYATSEICQIGGDFLISSGRGTLIVKDNRPYDFQANIEGTAIRLTLNVVNLKALDESLIQKIITKGEERAKSNSITTNITASKVSRVLP